MLILKRKLYWFLNYYILESVERFFINYEKEVFNVNFRVERRDLKTKALSSRRIYYIKHGSALARKTYWSSRQIRIWVLVVREMRNEVMWRSTVSSDRTIIHKLKTESIYKKGKRSTFLLLRDVVKTEKIVEIGRKLALIESGGNTVSRS